MRSLLIYFLVLPLPVLVETPRPGVLCSPRPQDWAEGKNLPVPKQVDGQQPGGAGPSGPSAPAAPHLQPKPAAPKPAAAKPAPAAAAESRGDDAFKLPPPPKRAVNVPTPGKPLAEAWELSQGAGKASGGSWYGENWLDWAGPLAAIVIGIISIRLFAVGNVEVPALATHRYFSPHFKAASLASQLYDSVKALPLARICPHPPPPLPPVGGIASQRRAPPRNASPRIRLQPPRTV